jgi:class 3 adenylate cyclase/YHS domain-containing protein
VATTPPLETFLFADLAGFTALTEVHGDEQAADLVERFCAQAREALPSYDAHEVKSIGDALLLHSADAVQAVRLAHHLARNIGGRHGFPGVRVGLHTGPAVERGDDWFGATVNLASRVSGAAAAGEVLVTEATRAAAETGLPKYDFRFVGAKRFKNVRDPVRVYAAVDSSQPETQPGRLIVDPVCRMAVDPARSEWQRLHRGVTHSFCSEACASAFETDPEHYHRQRSSRAHLRVSEAARERTAAFLRRAYRRGRIDLEELDERLAHVFVAKDRGELGAVASDLPGHRRLRRRTNRRWFRPAFLRRLFQRRRRLDP